MTPLNMHLGKIDEGGFQAPALVLPGSNRPFILALICCVALIVVGAGIIAMADGDTGQTVIGALSIVTFALVIPIALLGILRGANWVMLSQRGIHGGRAGDLFVPWAAVVGIKPLTIQRSSSVGIALTNDPAVRIPRRQSVGRGLTRSMYGVDVAVGGSTDETRTLQLAMLIAYYADDPARRQEIGRTLPPVFGHLRGLLPGGYSSPAN